MTQTSTAPDRSEHRDPASFDRRPSEAALRRLAVRRLRQKQAFRGHLLVYVAVNLAFWTVWVVGGIVDAWIFPWPVFPTVFWGLFVLGQANDLYWRKPLSEQRVQREIERLRAASPFEQLDRDDHHDSWRWMPPMRWFDDTRRRDDA